MLVFYIYILVLKSLFPLAKVLSKVYKKDKPTLDRKKLLKYGRLLNIKSRHKLIQLSCMVLGKSPLVNSLDQTPPNLTLTLTLTLTQVGFHRGGGGIDQREFSVHQAVDMAFTITTFLNL